MKHETRNMKTSRAGQRSEMGNNFDLWKMRKNLKLIFGSWNRHIWSVFGVNFDNQMTYDWIPTQNFVNFHFEKNNLQSSISVEFQGNFWSLVSFYFFVMSCNSFRFLKALACKMPIKHRNGQSGEYIGQNRCQSGKIFFVRH